MAKENITEEEELVEDFGDGYFGPPLEIDILGCIKHNNREGVAKTQRF